MGTQALGTWVGGTGYLYATGGVSREAWPPQKGGGAQLDQLGYPGTYRYWVLRYKVPGALVQQSRGAWPPQRVLPAQLDKLGLIPVGTWVPRYWVNGAEVQGTCMQQVE